MSSAAPEMHVPTRRMSPAQSVESADTVPVSSPGSLTVPEMLANIKTTMISKCRPVRKVQPPSENMCLVGQSSGRIQWIQPSGRALLQFLPHALHAHLVRCSLILLICSLQHQWQLQLYKQILIDLDRHHSQYMKHLTLSRQHSLNTPFLAGPRRPGEGIEDEAQGIVDVQETASG